MSQQMVNGSHYDGSVTITNRMSQRYAVVGEPLKGKYKKPQDKDSLMRRKLHWKMRNNAKLDEVVKLLTPEYSIVISHE